MVDEVPAEPLTLEQLERMRDDTRAAFEKAFEELTRLEILLSLARRRTYRFEESDRERERLEP